MTKHQKVAFLGVGLLLASMALWLVRMPLKNPALLLFPAYAAALSAVMALIGSRHAGWHLLLIRLVAACTLIGFALLGLCLVAVAIFNGVYGIAVGTLIAMPSFAWWRFLYSKFDWTGDGDAATARILATGGVATLTVAVVLVVLELLSSMSGMVSTSLATTSLASAGALLITLGGYGWRRELRASGAHLHLPHAAVIES